MKYILAIFLLFNITFAQKLSEVPSFTYGVKGGVIFGGPLYATRSFLPFKKPELSTHAISIQARCITHIYAAR